MKCQLVQEQIVSATYGELAEEQANELERHMAPVRSAPGARATAVAEGDC